MIERPPRRPASGIALLTGLLALLAVLLLLALLFLLDLLLELEEDHVPFLLVSDGQPSGPRFLGYEASNQLSVKVRDVKLMNSPMYHVLPILSRDIVIDGISIESPWIAGDFLYMISVNSELVAINRADGRIQWVTQLPEFKNPEKKIDRIIWTGPVLASDRLIVASSTERAYAVSPYDGRIMGRASARRQ